MTTRGPCKIETKQGEKCSVKQHLTHKDITEGAMPTCGRAGFLFLFFNVYVRKAKETADGLGCAQRDLKQLLPRSTIALGEDLDFTPILCVWGLGGVR